MSGPWPVTLLRLLLPLLFIRVCCDSNCLLSESGGMEVLARLKTLSPVQQRRAAALLGAIVADAAGKARASYPDRYATLAPHVYVSCIIIALVT